ncbi:outer membrane beta-barrel protein [Hallella sp.]|uniref:outer membrane beta-barrel protein n=1 Tax=Hallella sp. TaxID=2980186 RepID=UPI002A91C3D8|nr:outer membrane beta-barrel protein [Hallella sp.]MDY5924533.1 outer membrane beta-barrel protein [Hallella sp.]
MRKLLLLIFIFTSSLAFAQKYHIDGFIRDSFTKEKLDSVNVTLMSMDSTVVETFRGKPYGWWQVYRDIKAPGKYIMKFEHDGYYPAYKNVDFKYTKYRHTGDSFGEILMHKIRMKKEVTLKEVVVTATKLKMVMRGDTIVYDADAFQLSSGSMLDKLIRLLPGAQLEPGGEIYINGQKVESLLVNGENFFNGDPKVALDNLPHYMVDKIKVYRKMDERLMVASDLRTLRKDQLPLVLDVGLKKEYTTSWVGNATVGYGTDHHHEARMFAMRFTPNSHIAMVGNSNDVRGDSYYSSDGNWQEPYGNTAEVTTHEVKVDGMLRDEDKKWKLSDQLSLKAQKRDYLSKTSTTMFLGDDVYSRYLFNNTNKNIKLGFSGTNSYTPSKQFTLDFTPKVSYYHYDNNYTSTSADFNRQLTERYMGEALDSLFGGNLESEYRKILISSLKNQYYGKGNELTTEGVVTSSYRIRDDRLSWSLSGYYNNKKNRSLNNYERVESANDMARFSDMPQRNYRYEGNIGYDYSLDFPALILYISPQYGFKQSYASDSRWHHILDGTEASAWGLDQLYSNRDSISRYIDYSNSYRSQTWNKTNTMGLDFSFYFKREDYKNITLDPSIQFRNVYDRISYTRAQTDTTIRRSRWLMEPSVALRIDANTGNDLEYHWRLNYKLQHQLPSLLYAVNYRDDATPLLVRESGYNLPNTHQHTASFSYERKMIKTQRFFNTSLTYRLWQNMLCQSMRYDMSTGVTTYRPDVIAGNWELSGQARYQMPLDKKRKAWKLTSQTNLNYRNFRDYLNSASATPSLVSSVRRFSASESLQVGYYRNYYSLTVSANVFYNHSESDRFATLNAFDFNYGVNYGMPLVWGIDFYTTLKMYSRRGYSDDKYNTDQFIVNFNLGKDIFKGKARLKFEVFDLLNKMSYYSYNINAQMQQETYTNLLRRYAMVSLTYRFSQKKKHTK